MYFRNKRRAGKYPALFLFCFCSIRHNARQGCPLHFPMMLLVPVHRYPEECDQSHDGCGQGEITDQNRRCSTRVHACFFNLALASDRSGVEDDGTNHEDQGPADLVAIRSDQCPQAIERRDDPHGDVEAVLLRRHFLIPQHLD